MALFGKRNAQTPASQAAPDQANQPRSALQKARGAATSALVPKGAVLAYDQFGRSRKNLAEALAAARETRARLLAESKLPIKTVHLRDGSVVELPTDPAERFEFLYQVMDWDEPHRQSQVRAARATKFACIGTTVISFVAVCFMVFWVPMWLACILIPASLLVLAIGMAQTFRWSLVEFQFSRRTLINFKTFLVQPNFFRWIFC